MPSHRERHPEYVDSCFACKALSVSFSASAMPNRKPTVMNEAKKEAQLSDDLPAYKRLRKNGTQPVGIDGSAEMEKRANDRFEIEMGHVVPKSHKSQVQDGLDMVREMKDAS